MKIGFIGCGKISEPMVRSLGRRFPDSAICVSQRSRQISERLEREFESVSVADNQSVIDCSDVVFVALLAKVAWEVLPKLRFRENQVVISVMADISLDEVASLIAPAKNPCVTIPLPFIETGGCPLPVYPESTVLSTLFGDENPVIVVENEAAIGPHFAATAILSTTMCALDTVGHWLGKQTGHPVNSEIYVASLVSGYLGALDKDGQQRFKEAMEDLSTEGGLNTQLLRHNKEGGVFDRIESGLDGLAERLAGD